MNENENYYNELYREDYKDQFLYSQLTIDQVRLWG